MIPNYMQKLLKMYLKMYMRCLYSSKQSCGKGINYCGNMLNKCGKPIEICVT